MLQRAKLIVVLLAAGALVACGGRSGEAAKPAASGGASGAQAITVKTSDQMRFTPATLTARAGAPISLTVDNSGSALIHDFTIDVPGGERVHIVAQPTGRGSGQFTLAAGTYQFYCAEPGHREAGMVGTLTVS
jgi:uncharacterized cupredoxin-like copper-binding protein